MPIYTNTEYIKKMTLTEHSEHDYSPCYNDKMHIAFADNDTLIAAEKYQCIAWNVKTGTQLWKQDTTLGCYNIAVSLHDSVFVYSDGEYSLNICDTKTGKVFQVFRRDEEHKFCKIIDLAFEPNSSIFAIGNADETITFMDVFGLYTPHTIRGIGEVTSLAWSPYGKIIAFANAIGTVKVFNLYTSVYPNDFETIKYGTRIRYLMGFGSLIPNRISTIALRPDGGRITAGHLASGSYDGTITIWESILLLGETRKLHTLSGHTDKIVSLAWSPNGTILASVQSVNGNIRLWNADNGENFAILQGTSIVDSLSFSPDGRTLASGGISGTVTIWERAD